MTNEIGLGGVSENLIQRRFTDLQGWMNQYVAGKADEVVLMVSGIATKTNRYNLKTENVRKDRMKDKNQTF